MGPVAAGKFALPSTHSLYRCSLLRQMLALPRRAGHTSCSYRLHLPIHNTGYYSSGPRLSDPDDNTLARLHKLFSMTYWTDSILLRSLIAA